VSISQQAGRRGSVPVRVMGLGVEPAAFSAPDHDPMGIMMGDLDQQFRLAAAAAMGLVPAAFPQRPAWRVFLYLGASGVFRGQQDHVELGHQESLSLARNWVGDGPV
jgi:hypothetical protein